MSLTWTAFRRIHWTRFTRIVYNSPHRTRCFSSVFEPEGSEDYRALPSVPTSSRPTPNDLSTLVRDGHFQMAEAVRDELLKDGIDIPLDTIYENAALWAVGALHQGKWNKSVPMCRWLALYPEYSAALRQPFHKICRVLLEYPAQNVHLIYRFAQVAASKGYTEMVQRQLLPVVAKYGKASMIENLRMMCLPPSLPEPAIGDDDCSSVFEEDAAHAHEYTLALPQSSAPTLSPLESLHLLIRSSNYNDAKHLLIELQSLQRDIPPSPVFERAAVLALQQPDLSETERLSDFRLWFSLVPTLHEAGECKFYAIRQQIFWAPATNLHLIIEFGLISAAKGYATLMNSVVIPVVMRYAPPEVSLKFVTEYEARHLTSIRSGLAKDQSLRGFSLLKSKTIRGIAIRHLADAGHYDAAMRLLPEGKLKGYLNIHTYQTLLHRIEKTGDSQYSEYIHTLRRTLAEIAIDHSGTAEAADEANQASLFITADAVKLDMPLPLALRYIKAVLMNHQALPHPNTIMDFMVLYTSTGRTKAFGLLRRRAFRSSYHAAALWIFAEMVLNYRNGLYRDLLQNFVDNFFLAGVPRAELLRELRSNTLSADNDDDSHLPATAAAEPIPNHIRIFPTRAHCSLVWQSLAQLTKSPHQLNSLYVKLLHFAENKGHVNDDIFPSSGSSSPPLLSPPNWQVTAESFTPFIIRMMRNSGSSAGTGVLRDMVSVGLQPTVYHFTELARYYAFNGEEKKAFLVLDRLEKRLEREEREKEALESSRAQNMEIDAGTYGAPEMMGRQAINNQASDYNEHTAEGLKESTETLEGLAQLQHQPDATPSSEQGQEISSPSPSPDVKDPINAYEAIVGVKPGARKMPTSQNGSPTPTTPALASDVPPSVHSSARPAPPNPSKLPTPDFVLYVALMRAFLGVHQLSAVAEIAKRLQARYPYVRGANHYLDKVYTDWATLAAAESRRKRKREGRPTASIR